MQTVLIVDDEQTITAVAAAILKRKGYEALTAYDAESAEKTLAESTVDLVLLDVVLPGRGGIDLLMSIRNAHPKIPVIIMSGKVSTDADPFRKLATQFGAKCILAKPFTAQELLESISAILSGACA
jgi:two-component system OmpR family response regulator